MIAQMFKDMFHQILQTKNFDEKARLLASLGDPTTLRIINTLITNKMICVSDIASKIGTSVSAVSHQLRKLRDLGLVRSERKGKMICYFLKDNNKLKFLRQVI